MLLKIIQAALEAVSEADYVILCLGIDTTQEGEGNDRTTITLPGLQESFASQVLDTAGSKPVILVIVCGGIVAFDDLVEPVSAIVQCGIVVLCFNA